MKTAIAMVLMGTFLFTGTVVGLLAAQGRLNFDGTRGMPVLSLLFTNEGGEPNTIGTAPDDPAARAPFEHPDLTDSERLEGLGREPELPREKGPAVDPGAPDPMGHAVREATQPEPAASPPGSDARRGDSAGAQGKTQVFRHAAESLMGQDQYRRGQLFSFQKIPSGMTVAEIDEIVGSAKSFEKTLQRREAALDQREADLAIREADIEERERAVLEKMREVLQERGRLDEQVASFQKTFTLVQANESEKYRSYAEHLASLPVEKSSQILLQLWQTEPDKEKAVKILKMMSTEARDEIFAVLSAEQTQEILDRVTGAVEEKKK